MRKATTLILAALALTAFVVTPIFACDHGAKTSANTGDAKAQMVGEHASCGAKGDAASAKMMGEKGACTAHGDMKMSAAECAAKCAAMSPEDLAKCVKYDGQVQMINMSVKGMTCGGCENSVRASLEKIDGVVKVFSVSYTDNTAMVVIDPTKTKPEALTTAIVNKGYTAEVIPAVATTTTMSEAHKSCTPEQKAACATKKAAETQETSDKQPH